MTAPSLKTGRPIPSGRGTFSRAMFLGRVLLGLTLVKDARRVAFVAIVSLGAGLTAAGLAFLLIPRQAPSLAPAASWIAASGIAASVLAAAASHLLAIRAMRKRQAAEFARAARRLGEEKTALSELRSALRRLARTIEGTIPEILAEDDGSDVWSQSPAQNRGASADDRDRRLAGRLLRIARAAAFFGGKDLELKRLPLAGPCAEIIEQYRRLVDPDREILYIEDGGGDWLSAPIDRPLFVLMVRELLDNVLEHAGDWSRITVTTEPVPGAIVLRVRDDGRGMTAGTLRDLMTGGARNDRGGLGLSLARAVAEAHGGSLRLESQSGHGTTVSLRFPTHE